MGNMQDITRDPSWVGTLNAYLKPHWDKLLLGEWAQAVGSGRMTVEEMRGWMLQIYPFIHAFPKFLAEALIKVDGFWPFKRRYDRSRRG